MAAEMLTRPAKNNKIGKKTVNNLTLFQLVCEGFSCTLFFFNNFINSDYDPHPPSHPTKNRKLQNAMAPRLPATETST